MAQIMEPGPTSPMPWAVPAPGRGRAAPWLGAMTWRHARPRRSQQHLAGSGWCRGWLQLLQKSSRTGRASPQTCWATFSRARAGVRVPLAARVPRSTCAAGRAAENSLPMTLPACPRPRHSHGTEVSHVCRGGRSPTPLSPHHPHHGDAPLGQPCVTGLCSPEPVQSSFLKQGQLK